MNQNPSKFRLCEKYFPTFLGQRSGPEKKFWIKISFISVLLHEEATIVAATKFAIGIWCSIKSEPVTRRELHRSHLGSDAIKIIKFVQGVGLRLNWRRHCVVEAMNFPGLNLQPECCLTAPQTNWSKRCFSNALPIIPQVILIRPTTSSTSNENEYRKMAAKIHLRHNEIKNT